VVQAMTFLTQTKNHCMEKRFLIKYWRLESNVLVVETGSDCVNFQQREPNRYQFRDHA
jgi:hypothetical protein